MTILVTGTGGHLGALTVRALLARGVDPDGIVATARGAAPDLGVPTRRADYDDPASLDAAFAGVSAVLLVSSNAVGSRLAQHRNVIDAAGRAGVSLLAYTSILDAEKSPMALADDHRETEALLRASGLPHAVLRNGWYFENYTAQAPVFLSTGRIAGSSGDGLVSAASRADYADAAAVVLTSPDQAGKVYELAGDTGFTMTDLAAEFTARSGTRVEYADLAPADHLAALTAAGLPEAYAGVLVDSDEHIRAGALHDTSSTLSRLIGRPTTTLAEAVESALA